jgi:hypothetical protein
MAPLLYEETLYGTLYCMVSKPYIDTGSYAVGIQAISTSGLSENAVLKMTATVFVDIRCMQHLVLLPQ